MTGRGIPLPTDEADRLRTLLACNVLDTPPETAFDDITALAAQICDSEIALISLVDENRQWFKAKCGLAASETPREWAFCAHAILCPGDLLIVNDARKDPRFSDNPLVIGDPFIRFYAGAPLVAGGHALGTLCVVDKRARRILMRQENMLRRLARIASALLETRLPRA